MTSSITSPRLTQLAGPQPDIVFIMADDLGYAGLGCYGDERERANLAAREPERLLAMREASVSLGYSVTDMPQI